jgi:hypothetical protein
LCIGVNLGTYVKYPVPTPPDLDEKSESEDSEGDEGGEEDSDGDEGSGEAQREQKIREQKIRELFMPDEYTEEEYGGWREWMLMLERRQLEGEGVSTRAKDEEVTPADASKRVAADEYYGIDINL